MPKTKIKCAVLMYGYMRTYKHTANSLIKNILKPNNADLFIYTFDNEGISIVPNDSGIFYAKTAFGHKQDNAGPKVRAEDLKKVYGSYLKSYAIKKFDRQKFVKAAAKVAPLSGTPVDRIYSLYNSIAEAAKLLLKYTEKHGEKYDAVIMVRPDLQFYAEANAEKLNLKALNIPNIGGNIKMHAPTDIYYVSGYKNVERCEYIPWMTVPFSDQFIISSFDNMKHLATLYDNLKEYEKRGFPTCHAESTVYYHLGFLHRLPVVLNDLPYEILRSNFKPYDNSFLPENPVKEGHGEYSQNLKKKYHLKTKDDISNMYRGIKALLRIPGHFVKWMYYGIRRRS